MEMEMEMGSERENWWEGGRWVDVLCFEISSSIGCL